jgi:hypothetical protein
VDVTSSWRSCTGRDDLALTRLEKTLPGTRIKVAQTRNVEFIRARYGAVEGM